MSDILHVDPSMLIETAADPGQFVVQCLERGKTWLSEALAHGDLDALANMKGYAETLRVATMQKQLGKDAEIAATELVRRAERAIGLGIRAGQEAGEINVRGSNQFHGNQHVGGEVREPQNTTKSPYDYADHTTLYGDGREGGNGAYALADDVSDAEFEKALAEAKSEGNVSRANVVRKAKGETDKPKPSKLAMPQPPKMGGNRRKHAAQLDALIVQIGGATTAFDGVTELDQTVTPIEAARLADGLDQEMKTLRKIHNLIKERTQ